MSVDDSLPLGRDTWLLPEAGAFVVFKTDPVATLEALEDPIATEQAQSLSLSCKSYIGFIDLVLDLPMETRKYHRCHCFVLSQGLAKPLPESYTDENMCIPVAPATHPQGRPAITAVPPLPWDNLYVHHSSLFTLRVKTDPRDIDHTHSPMISLRDLVSVQRYRSEDSDRQQLWRIAEMPPPPPPARRSVDHHETDALLQEEAETEDCSEAGPKVDTEGADSTSSLEDADSASTAEATDTASVSEAADTASIPEELYRVFVNREDPVDQFIPVVSFDLDVTAVSEFAEAHELREEIRAMTRIRVESKQRATEVLQRLDEERAAREHRMNTSSMTSHPSTHAPHSPILSSAAAISRSLLSRPPTSIWDKAKSISRPIFSSVHKEKNSNMEKERETEKEHETALKEHASPSCLPICGPLGDRMKGVHRAVCRLASKLLRRAHRGLEAKVQAQPPPDAKLRSGKN